VLNPYDRALTVIDGGARAQGCTGGPPDPKMSGRRRPSVHGVVTTWRARIKLDRRLHDAIRGGANPPEAGHPRRFARAGPLRELPPRRRGQGRRHPGASPGTVDEMTEMQLELATNIREDGDG